LLAGDVAAHRELSVPASGHRPPISALATHTITHSDWVKVSRPIGQKVGHFRDVLASQSLGMVLKDKSNTTTAITQKHKVSK